MELEFSGQLQIPVVDGHIKPAVSLHWKDAEHEDPYPSFNAYLIKCVLFLIETKYDYVILPQVCPVQKLEDKHL